MTAREHVPFVPTLPQERASPLDEGDVVKSPPKRASVTSLDETSSTKRTSISDSKRPSISELAEGDKPKKKKKSSFFGSLFGGNKSVSYRHQIDSGFAGCWNYHIIHPSFRSLCQ